MDNIRSRTLNIIVSFSRPDSTNITQKVTTANTVIVAVSVGALFGIIIVTTIIVSAIILSVWKKKGQYNYYIMHVWLITALFYHRI